MDGAALNTLHQMRHKSGNLVADPLGRNDRNLINDTLVGVEVKGQAAIVLLDDDAGGLFNGFITNTLNISRKQSSFLKKHNRLCLQGGV